MKLISPFFLMNENLQISFDIFTGDHWLLYKRYPTLTYMFFVVHGLVTREIYTIVWLSSVFVHMDETDTILLYEYLFLVTTLLRVYVYLMWV